MTDPLTAKELVEKSYEYVDKLTRECSRSVIDDFNKTHRKFAQPTVAQDVSTSVLQWFEKRDKNVRLSFDPASVSKPEPSQVRLRFKGNTKDADFTLNATIGTFVPPRVQNQPDSICFVKSLVFSADKVNFTRRKT